MFTIQSPLANAASGIKKTVAVFEFTNDSGYGSKVNLGKDFSTQLSDALVQSDQFIVLTRKDLDVVMAEQDLAQSDRFAKSKAAQTGKLTSAQILIKGKITEFTKKKSGGGQGFSIKGFSIGAKKSSAHIAVIIQLVDSTTGEILHSKRVEGDAKAGGLSLGYSGEFDISSSNFKKTPLGKALQIAIDNAVEYIAQQMADIPWRGKVVLMKNGIVFINAGENSGINRGDTFSVYKEGEALIDPDTGINLGSDTAKIADISVVEVKEKFSKAKVLGTASGQIAKGDIVKQ
jgi:curli biogenesis system outer membrane secretion channel CsgG